MSSNFEDRLKVERGNSFEVLNIFGGGSELDAEYILQKLRKFEQVVLLSGLGGFCDEMVTFLKNPNGRQFDTDLQRVWINLEGFRTSANLHVIDLSEENSHQNLFTIASQMMSPEKQLKLGKISLIHS